MKRLCLILCACLLDIIPALAADPYASGWVKGIKSSARLIGAGGEPAAYMRAGVEIALDARTLTYWHAPGDAGVPPVFSFRSSQNIDKVEVLYPAPSRIMENNSEIFGYQGGVIFPLHVFLRDKAAPAVLDLKLDYAACEKICVPAQAQLTLALPAAKSPPGAQAGRIALAEARVPLRQDFGAAKPFSLRAIKRLPDNDKPAFEAEIAAPPGVTAIEIFPDAPDYWFVKAGAPVLAKANVFTVPLRIEDKPRDAKQVEIAFTIIANGEAIEVTKLLDLGAVKP